MNEYYIEVLDTGRNKIVYTVHTDASNQIHAVMKTCEIMLNTLPEYQYNENITFIIKTL